MIAYLFAACLIGICLVPIGLAQESTVGPQEEYIEIENIPNERDKEINYVLRDGGYEFIDAYWETFTAGESTMMWIVYHLKDPEGKQCDWYSHDDNEITVITPNLNGYVGKFKIDPDQSIDNQQDHILAGFEKCRKVRVASYL